jgi:hypothetical protein
MLLIVLFCVLFVCKCVLNYCHWVLTQLQLTNISISTTVFKGADGKWLTSCSCRLRLQRMHSCVQFQKPLVSSELWCISHRQAVDHYWRQTCEVTPYKLYISSWEDFYNLGNTEVDWVQKPASEEAWRLYSVHLTTRNITYCKLFTYFQCMWGCLLKKILCL